MNTLSQAPPVKSEPVELTECPACGCTGNVFFTVTLDYGAADGYRPDYFGVEPVQGDTITRCDDCAAFFVHAPDGTLAGQAEAAAPSVAGTSTSDPEPDPEDPAKTAAELEAKVAELQAELDRRPTLDELRAEVESLLAAKAMQRTPPAPEPAQTAQEPPAPAPADVPEAAPEATDAPETPPWTGSGPETPTTPTS